MWCILTFDRYLPNHTISYRLNTNDIDCNVVRHTAFSNTGWAHSAVGGQRRVGPREESHKVPWPEEPNWDNGWKCYVYPVEVGCRGFVGQSTVKFLNAIGVAPRIRQATIRKLQETVETASAWIWNSLDQMETYRTWHDLHAHHHPPGSATAVLLGPPIHTTPTGIGPKGGMGSSWRWWVMSRVSPVCRIWLC